MARGKVATPTNIIEGRSSQDELTVESELYQARLDNEKKIQEYRNECVKKLAELELTIAEKQALQEEQFKLKRLQAIVNAEQKARLSSQIKDEKDLQKVRASAEAQFIKEQRIERLKLDAELHNSAKRLKEEELQAEKELRNSILNDSSSSFSDKAKALGGNVGQSLKEQFSISNSFKQLGDKLTALSNQLNTTISSFATYQSSINTRIQDSGKTFQSVSEKLTRSIGASPFLKTEDLYENLAELVNQGIVYNLEQRAFLGTISDKIATTFEVHNATMLRLIRLQQNDSTASRLGLEAYLTRFLNNTFQNSEYLNDNFDNVSKALIEASSLLSSDSSIQFEYVVQKWLGSLASVGLSDDAVSNIAGAIGNLASGNVSALSSNTGMQNLIVMASSRAGLDYSRILTDGFSDATETNKLLQSIVDYMQQIASTDNKVVKSQFADVFGVKVSDLTASLNLTSDDISTISNNFMNSAGAIEELEYQLNSISDRMHLSEKMENLFANAVYGLSKNVAESPALYGVWKTADLITSLTGGIGIPAITTMFGGVDLNTTVDQLIKNGVVVASAFGMIDDILTGLGNSSSRFSNVMEDLNIGALSDSIVRGSGLKSRTSGESTSAYSYVGNSNSEDIQGSVLNRENDSANKTLEAKKEASTEADLTDIHSYLTKSLDLRIDETNKFLAGTLNSKMDSIISLMMLSNGITSVAGGEVGGSLDSRLATILHKETSIQVTKADDTTSLRNEMLNDIGTNVQNIYNMLNSVIVGGTLRVAMGSGYGTL